MVGGFSFFRRALGTADPHSRATPRGRFLSAPCRWTLLVYRSARSMSCPSSGVASVALVTLSLGSRPFVQYTKPLMEAYAKSIGVSFHSVDSYAHDAMQGIPKNLSTRFRKLPLLEHFLRRYERVMYVDDDVLIGPAAASLFALTPCHSLGATLERHKPAGWHALHRRAACDLYHSPNNAVWCSGGGNQLIFNSGVMVLSRDAHLPHLARWRGEKLVCRVLCDQLYLNALLHRTAGMTLHDLGGDFNYVGSELTRAVTTSGTAGDSHREAAARRRVAVRDACLLHLTRKVPKLYTADWVTHRALSWPFDVLQCARNATPPRGSAARKAGLSMPEADRRRAILARLPSVGHKYEIGAQLCGKKDGCCAQRWALSQRAPGEGNEGAYDSG